MRLSKRVILPVAIALGTTSGLLWFRLGESLDNHMSNAVAWGLCPAVLPLVIAVLLFLISSSATVATRAVNSLLFFVVYYTMHWAPMGTLFGLLLLLGGKM